jgi:hypothetical protein
MDFQDEVTDKLYNSGVYVSWNLSLRLYRKACIRKISNRAGTRTGFGKPTVRDRREAYENVSYGQG